MEKQVILLNNNQEVSIDSGSFILGYDISPEITRNTDADPNTTYKYKRWTREDKCEPIYNCEIEGKHLVNFLIANVKCKGKQVFGMARRLPYKEPTCLREIPDLKNEKTIDNKLHNLNQNIYVNLEIRIYDCFQYKIKTKGRTSNFDYSFSHENITIHSIDSKVTNIYNSKTSSILDRVTDGKLSFFDIHIENLICSNMQDNPNLVFSVRSSPFRYIKPHMTIKASRSDRSDLPKTIFNGQIDESNRIINVFDF